MVVVTILGGCSLGTPPNPTQKPVQIILWQGVNPPPNRDVLDQLVAEFNRTHPQIQVESLYVGQPDQQLPKVLAAVVGNAPPDLLWYNPTITGQLVDLGALRPLDDWFKTASHASELDPALRETMDYQGHLWSVPFATNNTGVFYRPSLFAQAGIKTPPTTWTELKSVARQLTRDTNGDGRVDQHGMMLALGKGDFAVFTWLPFLWAAGAELTPIASPQGPVRVNLDQPAIAEAIGLWADLVQEGSAILSQPERGYELDNFLAGKVAMQISGPWTLGQLAQAQVDFDVFPIPAYQRQATGLGGENLFVFKTNSTREQAALVFADYVLSQAFQTQWALKTGYLPVNLKSRQDPAYQAFVASQPTLKVFLDQMQVARSRPLFAGYARVSDNLGRALEAAVLGKATPQAALAAAQQRLELIWGKSADSPADPQQ
jgi:multiple sugar transport system substrate-binding protein